MSGWCLKIAPGHSSRLESMTVISMLMMHCLMGSCGTWSHMVSIKTGSSTATADLLFLIIVSSRFLS